MAPFQVEIKWTTAHFPALPKLTSQQGLKWGGVPVYPGEPLIGRPSWTAWQQLLRHTC